jgi:hypothetical protein
MIDFGSSQFIPTIRTGSFEEGAVELVFERLKGL